MARKSQEQIREEERLRAEEINKEAERRVLEMLPGIIAKLADQRVAAGVAVDPTVARDDRSFAESLAVAIVKAGDPRQNKQQLDPAVAAARRKAREAMVDLLVEYRGKGIVPLYTCRGKMYLNDVKIDPQYQDPGTKEMRDTQIRWPKVPNEAMVPADDAARAIYSLFEKSNGTINGRSDIPRPPWMEAHTPWVFGKDGIVRGHAVAPAAPPSQGVFEDPRMQASVPNAKQEVRVLGTSAPPVVIGP